MKFALTALVVALLMPVVLLSQEVLNAVVESNDPVLVSFQNKIRDQEKTIDSLILLMMHMKEETIVNDIDTSEELDEDIVKLGKLALRFDQKLFEVFNAETELEEIRKYFLPRFSANFVTIDKDGSGSIAIVTHENLGEHLGSIMEDKRSYKIVNIDFLDTKVAGNVFNMAYKTLVEAYVDGKLYTELSVLTTLTGRRDEHLWKIGSYSSTSIEFEPENN